MGLKSSTLLQEEDIEELQNETGCKLKAFCENLRLKLPAEITLSDSTVNFVLEFFYSFSRSNQKALQQIYKS